MPVLPRYGGVTGSFVISGGGSVRGVSIGPPTPSPKGKWNTVHNNDVVEFDRDAFARFVAADKQVRWQQRLLCPNRADLAPEQNHNQDCCVCDGRGWLITKDELIFVQMTSFTENEQRRAEGWWTPGTVSVTAMPEYRLSIHDRLIMTAGAVRYDELLVRRCNTDYDIPRFNILSRADISNTEATVQALVWVNRSKQARTFTQDVEFVVDAGRIRWLTTDRVDVGDTYTLSYYCRPQYVIVDLPHILRTRFFGLGSGGSGVPYEYPVQAAAQLETQIREMRYDHQIKNYRDPLK